MEITELYCNQAQFFRQFSVKLTLYKRTSSNFNVSWFDEKNLRGSEIPHNTASVEIVQIYFHSFFSKIARKNFTIFFFHDILSTDIFFKGQEMIVFHTV